MQLHVRLFGVMSSHLSWKCVEFVFLLFLILSFIGFKYETNDEFRACKVLFETNG